MMITFVDNVDHKEEDDLIMIIVIVNELVFIMLIIINYNHCFSYWNTMNRND